MRSKSDLASKSPYFVAGVFIAFLAVGVTVAFLAINQQSAPAALEGNFPSKHGPNLALSQPAPTIAQEHVESTKVFINKTYGYSFRYPDEFKVSKNNSDCDVVLQNARIPVLTFSVITRQKERQLLQTLEASALAFAAVQDELVRVVHTEENQPKGVHLGFVGLKPFRTDSMTSEPTASDAYGFTLTNLTYYSQDLDGENTTLLHLRDGNVLQIRQHRTGAFSSDVNAHAILQSINPFVRP